MTRQELIDNFGNTLKPLYKELINSFEKKLNTEICDWWLSCAQWGKLFPIETNNKGIVFYGRSTNEWDGYSYDPDVIFSKPYKYIFNADDQMEWMWSKHNAFINLLRRVSKHFYEEEWNQHIAWSNICKIQPDVNIPDTHGKKRYKVNPSCEEYDAQYVGATKILEAELNFFSPKVIVLVTGVPPQEQWEWPLYDIERFQNVKDNYQESIVWGTNMYGSKLKAESCNVDGTVIIRCDRPEYNSPIDESEAIISLIERNINR